MGGNKSNKSEIKNITNFYKSREEIIKFYNYYFKMVHKAAYDRKLGKSLKILSINHMSQRLPIALGQVKAGITSKSLLNQIRQIMYFLYHEKEITRKVYNNIMNLISLYKGMGTIFIYSGNDETPHFYRLLLNHSDKINLRRSDKYVALSNITIYYT